MRAKQVILLLFISYNTIAQVQENLLLERNYMNAFNPAFVGSEGKEFGFVNRSNWGNISNSPKTSYLFYSGDSKKNLTLVRPVYPKQTPASCPFSPSTKFGPLSRAQESSIGSSSRWMSLPRKRCACSRRSGGTTIMTDSKSAIA